MLEVTCPSCTSLSPGVHVFDCLLFETLQTRIWYLANSLFRLVLLKGSLSVHGGVSVRCFGQHYGYRCQQSRHVLLDKVEQCFFRDPVVRLFGYVKGYDRKVAGLT